MPFPPPLVACASCWLAAHGRRLRFQDASAPHPAILYDAPSTKGGKLYVAPRGMPVEVVLSYGDWVKVRDVNGDLAWTEAKDLIRAAQRRSCASANAKVRASADDNAPVVLTADKRRAARTGRSRSRPRGCACATATASAGYVKASDVWGISSQPHPCTTPNNTTITVLGAGAWGTAVAIALAARHDVLLWGRNRAQMAARPPRAKTSPTCPAFRCPPLARHGRLRGGHRPRRRCARRTPLLIAACPVAGLRPLLEQLKGRAIPEHRLAVQGLRIRHRPAAAPGGARGAGRCRWPGAALSGPSFAQEVARGLPCALTVASSSPALRERVVALVHGGNMRVYSCDDLVGVEVGGAVKNILAIATGAADGLGLGLNARAALITRGLAEITRLGTALGAQPGTFMGLTGMGDLILTCTGDLSRNRRVGLALAQGKPLDTIVRGTGPRGRRRALRQGRARTGGEARRGHADHQCGGRRAVRWRRGARDGGAACWRAIPRNELA